ncbi:MAG: DedA family protein [Nitrospirae bacterium]|nr:MAG: DedA family protein [Nitrospirota bacterium]
MFEELYHWMLSWAESPYAVPALFGLAFAESSFFPVPPDVLLMALTLGNPSWGMYYAAVTTAGSVLGGIGGYAIGWGGGRPLLRRLIGAERMQTIHDAFERYEGWAILIAGFTPVPYKVFTIGAGAFYVNFKIFVLASMISRGARFFLVAGAIQLLGPWMKALIEAYFNYFTVVFVLLLILGFIGVGHRIKRTTHSHVQNG